MKSHTHDEIYVKFSSTNDRIEPSYNMVYCFKDMVVKHPPCFHVLRYSVWYIVEAASSLHAMWSAKPTP